MRRVEFTCDICGDVVGKKQSGTGEWPFVGFTFGLMCDHHKVADRFVAEDPSKCEHHVCHRCLAGLVALARRTLPATTFKEGMSID